MAGISLGLSPDDLEETTVSGGGGVEDDQDDDGNNPMTSGSGYLGGFMGKFMGSTGASGVAGNNNGMPSVGNDKEDQHNSYPNRQRNQQHYPLYPPRNHCVSSANGWVIASLESAPTTQTPSHSSTSSHPPPSANVPPLRLISRWNVRRSNNSNNSSTNNNNMRENLIALPPPLFDRDHAKICHVFCDPTGYHTIFSSMNGEAYYLHANKRYATKLVGFGMSRDGATGSGSSGGDWNTAFQPGISAMEASSISDNSKATIQLGLTPGSYITSVGWDKKRGTEGSTKKILLGTSFGEIYEYSLVNRNNNDDMNMDETATGPINARDKSNIFLTGGDNLPMLLVRLNSLGSDRNSTSGAVTGLFFERLNVGNQVMGGDNDDDLIVLATTSGTNLQTRLHTYLSISSLSEMDSSSPSRSTFRTVFSNSETSQSSFVELPGSINFADLKVCANGFAMKTETGIYHGTIASDSIEKRSKGSNGILDAGILPYETNYIPVSIAITPHHLITLSETNELRFVSRVAKKTIQKERVDWVSMTQGSSTTPSDDEMYNFGQSGELLTDIRRPDQIWFRKSRTLVHISSTCEGRDDWKFTLRRCLDMSHPKSSKAINTGVQQSFQSPISSSRKLSKEDKLIEAEFDNAIDLCSNESQRAVVTAARAEFHLAHGRIELASKYMAQCPSTLMPFVESSVRLGLPSLMNFDPTNNDSNSTNSNVGLINYLSDKMRSSKTSNDSVACTMIGAWLVELLLHERELGGSMSSDRYNGSNKWASSNIDSQILQQFLSSNVDCMDANTIVQILSSHDVIASECTEYAARSGDIGTAVNAAFCMSDSVNGALDALRVLNDSPFEQAESFYYKHAFTLLSRVPMEASKSFLGKYNQGLSATKLLPSLMHYESQATELGLSYQNEHNLKGNSSSSSRVYSKQHEDLRAMGEVELSIDEVRQMTQSRLLIYDENASIKYLEGVIKLGCQSTAVQNYLVSLYVKMDDEGPLFEFLSSHISSTQQNKVTSLDLSYILRLILRTGRHYRCVVKLYMGLGMRQRAVELAIKVDPGLAKELACESVDPEEKKRLWLMIARDAAADEDNTDGKDVVSKVLSILGECGPGVLSIEDVLPFLPDVAQIDQFKDEICDALTSYSSRIEQHLTEMSECDHTCQTLRDEINNLSDYKAEMKSNARCAFTQKMVLDENEPFYIFPSGYVTLESPLKNEVIPYLNSKQRSRLDIIEKELVELKSTTDNEEKDEEEVMHELDVLQAELDGLIAAECPLTGTVMVESIDRSFLDGMEDTRYCLTGCLVDIEA